MSSPLRETTAFTASQDVEPEAPARRQHGKKFAFYLDTPDGEAEHEVLITNRERLHFERTAAKHPDWPSPANGQNFAMTFCIWSAAKRAGLTAATFDEFAEAMIDYDLLDEVPADPTR